MLPWRERLLVWQPSMLSSKRNIYRLTSGSVLQRLPKELSEDRDNIYLQKIFLLEQHLVPTQKTQHICSSHKEAFQPERFCKEFDEVCWHKDVVLLQIDDIAVLGQHLKLLNKHCVGNALLNRLNALRLPSFPQVASLLTM